MERHAPDGTIEAISIDCLIFGFNNGSLEILLVQHGEGISKGRWALPGGFVGVRLLRPVYLETPLLVLGYVYVRRWRKALCHCAEIKPLELRQPL